MALQVEERAEVEVEAKRHIITVDEFARMCEAGVFGSDAWMELFRGEIVDMPPPNPPHTATVVRLQLFLTELLERRALVWPQGNPITLLNSNSTLMPDVTVLQWSNDYYGSKWPSSEAVILVVEVSYSTLSYDRKGKLALYAEAGIPQYWVVNLVDGVVEVYTDPAEGKYASVKVAQRGETIEMPGELGGSVAVDEVLGRKEE